MKKIESKIEKLYNVTRLIHLDYDGDGVNIYMCISCRNGFSIRYGGFDFSFCPHCGRPIVGCMWKPTIKEPDYDTPEYENMMKIRRLKSQHRYDSTQKWHYEVRMYSKSFWNGEKMTEQEKNNIEFKEDTSWKATTSVKIPYFENGKRRLRNLDFEFDTNRDIAKRETRKRYSMIESLAQYNWLLKYLPQSSSHDFFFEHWYKVCLVKYDDNDTDAYNNREFKILKSKIIMLPKNESDDDVQ